MGLRRGGRTPRGRGAPLALAVPLRLLGGEEGRKEGKQGKKGKERERQGRREKGGDEERKGRGERKGRRR